MNFEFNCKLYVFVCYLITCQSSNGSAVQANPGLLLTTNIPPRSLLRWSNNSYVLSTHRESDRRGKLLKVWNLVVFPNSVCRATSNSDGTCVSERECTSAQGGTSSGTCAAGFGVCCVFELTCGATVRNNVTYFINPDSPDVSTEARSCILQVNKINNNVVQLRLDFETFMLNGVLNGICNTDVFVVTGQDADSPIPPICGLNNGQHIYVNVANVPSPIMLGITTSGAGNRQWRIKVTQLERGNALLAPSECLQYFLGPTGTLKSFNFDSPVPVNGQSNYVNNLNYALCIRREAGSCMTRYSVALDANSFDVGSPDAMSGLDGTCTDFLSIPAAGNAPPAGTGSGSRFCGVALSATAGSTASNPLLASLAGPIQLAFFTDAILPSASFDRGFNIRFQQIPCSNSG